MKIRNGFVSNSSSSSFVIVGFKIDKNAEDIEEMLEKLRNKCPDLKKIDYLTDDGPYYVGMVLMDVSDEDGGFPPTEMPFEDFQKFRDTLLDNSDVIEEVLGSKPQISIWYGTRAS
jgi:hypothetical protein